MAAPTQQAAVVPAVTQQALAAITDINVQAVLQQLVTGWQTRNGQSGDGSNAFITRGDLGIDQSSMGFGTGGALQSVFSNPAFLQSGAITALINAISASILADPFFQSLGTAINAIDISSAQHTAGIANLGSALVTETTNRTTADTTALTNVTTQFSVVNGNVGALQTSLTTVANSAAASASAITTLSSSVSGNTVAIQNEATTRANTDGTLLAQWTVKIDINGYISGFGLASTAGNAAPASAFYVRADRFAIGSPSGPGVSPVVPFVVYTSPVSIGGQAVPAGIYMTRAVIANGIIDTAAIALAAITTALIANAAIGTAQIQNAAITNAQIGFAAIDSLRLAGRCVTVQASYNSSSSNPNGYTLSINYTTSGGNLVLFYSATLGSNGGGGEGSITSGTMSLLVNGGSVAGVSGSAGAYSTGVCTSVVLGPGTYNFQIQVFTGGPPQLNIFEAFH